MNSTNVPSNKTKNSPASFCAEVVPKNERELEIPPQNAKIGISRKETIEAIENGDYVIAEVGNGYVNENNQLVSKGSNEVIANMQQGAFDRIKEGKEKRKKTREVEPQDIAR